MANALLFHSPRGKIVFVCYSPAQAIKTGSSSEQKARPGLLNGWVTHQLSSLSFQPVVTEVHVFKERLEKVET